MTGSAAAGSIRTAAAVSSFSPFTFASITASIATNPLPIELLSFTANYNGHSVDLKWKTATEVNNDFFTVERSTDAQNFSSIGIVYSKATGGNSTSPLSYYLNDADVKEGTYYYRLKQVDYDGHSSYSKVAVVPITEENAVFVIKPNPTSGTSDIVYNCNDAENPTLNVFDSRGRLVLTKTISCVKGENVTSLDLSEQSEGLFYVTLTTSTNVYKSKLVRNK